MALFLARQGSSAQARFARGLLHLSEKLVCEKQMRTLSAVALLALMTACSAHQPTETGGTPSLNPASAAAVYTQRVGVAVTTEGRTCIAIKNANLAVNSPVTLVLPNIPQSFVEAQIGATSDSACPITKDVDRNITNYELHLPGGTAALKKLVPMIAVVGPANPFLLTNTNVQADLQGDGKHEMFRSCSADDGIHLTMWADTPLSGALLWHGYYYEPSNPGIGPACTPQDTKGI